MKTGIITTDTCLNHDTGHGHPERADRVTVIIENLGIFEWKLFLLFNFNPPWDIFFVINDKLIF